MNLDKESEGKLFAGDDRKIVMRLLRIALVDPVSGYRCKICEGPGLPDKNRFLADMSVRWLGKYISVRGAEVGLGEVSELVAWVFKEIGGDWHERGDGVSGNGELDAC